jgi:hypothetical protein
VRRAPKSCIAEWHDRAGEWKRFYFAKRRAEPPDTKAERAEKDALVREWLKRRKPKKLPPGMASFVGFKMVERIDEN